MNLAKKIACSFAYFLLLFTISASNAEDGIGISADKEQSSLGVLKSDAPASEKAMACKRLAIDGSGESVPELAKLLPDPQLSSWARIALEAIPGSASDEALRSAAESLQGNLLIGTLNSIGVRRDAGAIKVLTKRLQDSDVEVASSAAVALGLIGNNAAAESLRKALADAPDGVRSAIAEGCVLCAERFLAEGNLVAAVELYDQVRNAKVPKQRIIEATRGAILARNQDGIPLLIELFKSPDKGMFQLALSTAREFPGSKIDDSLAQELTSAQPERAALIVQSMADRTKTVNTAAILKAAEQGPMLVRLSAINALGRVGDESCLTSLLKMAVDTDASLAQSAKTTLADLPGNAIDTQVVSLLSSAEGSMVPVLVEIIAKRRINAVPALLKMLNHPEAAIRGTALTALGETIQLDQLSILIEQTVAPKFPVDQASAQLALKAASVRMPDREACATQLAAAVDSAQSIESKTSLLQTLAAVGGTNALKAVAAAGSSANPKLQDVSSRLLGEWMTEDAAPVLLDLAKSATNQYQVRSIRGYIRIARQFVLPEEQRFQMCQKAYDASRQPAEKKLVLDILKRYPTMDGLLLTVKAIQVPELKSEANQATMVIAQKLSSRGVDVAGVLSQAGLEKVKIEIVKAEYGAGSVQKDVTAILQKLVGSLPIVDLPSDSYNAAFGGDPIANTVKSLKIQYLFNGKPAEVTLAENALIILPAPK